MAGKLAFVFSSLTNMHAFKSELNNWLVIRNPWQMQSPRRGHNVSSYAVLLIFDWNHSGKHQANPHARTCLYTSGIWITLIIIIYWKVWGCTLSCYINIICEVVRFQLLINSSYLNIQRIPLLCNFKVKWCHVMLCIALNYWKVVHYYVT